MHNIYNITDDSDDDSVCKGVSQHTNGECSNTSKRRKVVPPSTQMPTGAPENGEEGICNNISNSVDNV